jgi:hypothetical protein
MMEHSNGHRFTKSELAVVQRTALLRALVHVDELFTEFDARYLDSQSHALIDELRTRTRERLELLIPHIDPDTDDR